MKIKLIIFIPLITALILIAQNDIIMWSKTFDGICHQEDVAYDVELTSDGGYVVAGVKWDQAPFSPDWIFPHMWILKLDINGDTLWTTTYYHNIEISDPLYNDYYLKYAGAYDIEQTSDGGYVLCGYADVEYPDSATNYIESMCIVKLDESGNVSWNKIYLEGYNNVAKTIKQTADGGYIVAGTVKLKNDSNKYDIYAKMMKINSIGDTLWTQKYQESDAFPLTGIKATNLYKIDINIQNEIFGVGTMYNGVSSNGWIIKIDENGNTLWSKDFGDIEGESFYDLDITKDDNLILVGNQYVRDLNAVGVWLNKISFDGDKLWTKNINSGVYGNSCYGNSIKQTMDDGFIIGGEISINSPEMWIVKTNDTGDTLWTKKYGTNTQDYASSIEQTLDNGYIVCGQTEGSYASDNSSDWTDMWVLKLDHDGNYTGIENDEGLLIDDYKLCQNFPNPFNNQTNIEYAIENISEVEITVYNSNGQLIQNLVNEKQGKGQYSIQYKADNLNSGVYYYRLKINGITKETKKMLYLK